MVDLSETSNKWIEVGNELSEILRLQSLPLGIRLLQQDEDFPEKIRRPSRDLGIRIAVCQGFTMARKYGWVVGMTAEDLNCAPATYFYGWGASEVSDEEIEQLFVDVGYASDLKYAKVQRKATWKLTPGKYPKLMIFPLNQSTVEPQTVLTFCNPAQLMRLVHASAYESSLGKIDSSSSGKFGSCGEGVIGTFLSNDFKIIIPGAGDRVFAAVQDDELAFSSPNSKIDRLVHGLKNSAKQIGMRYPITPYQMFEPRFPRQYEDFFKRISE